MDTASLDRIRDKILSGDNKACFLERETILREHAAETRSLPASERYLHEFQLLMHQLSTPVEEDDVFAGRMLEGRWPYPDDFTRLGLASEGHITLAMPEILEHGLAGIARRVSQNAARIQTEKARYFERQALGCIEAIRHFCERYAEAAGKAGKPEMARALRTVPYGPAYDLYSALQSIWMMQFLCSTVCGSRDFAPGRIDQYLGKYLDAPREKALFLMAHFLMKFNEITGTATDNFARKPLPCHSSKQYIVLGPEWNEVSRLVVEAAQWTKMPQPTLNFRVGDDFSLPAHAARTLATQCNFFQDRIILNKLLDSGIPPEIARNYSFTACNRVDLPGILGNRMCRIDHFDNPVLWFRQAVLQASEVAEVPQCLFSIAYQAIRDDIRQNCVSIYTEDNIFRFESLFVDSCIQTCRDILQGGADLIRWHHRMFSGIANMADSMASLQRLRKRMPYADILGILENDFTGHEELRQEILHQFPKFGNDDPEADDWAARLGNVLIDAFEKAAREQGFLPMPSFYSLTHHARQGSQIDATPDGRKAGETLSENQSPMYGMDHEGITALLRSVASLPLKRCICGGLNVKFSALPSEEHLASLMETFFRRNGLHVGFTIVERATLEDARKHPGNYRTLMIRKTGFSEFYVALSPLEQTELIRRTEY